MNDKIYDAFDVCFSALETGVDIESVLGLYPDLADEIRPALEAAQMVKLLSPAEPTSEMMQRSRTRLLGYAANRRQQPALLRWLMGVPRLVVVSVVTLIVVLFGGTSLLAASAESLPGDQIYPIKLAVESLSMQLTPSQEQKQTLQEAINERRVDEVKDLISIGRQVRVNFHGEVQEQYLDFWVVNGIVVNLSADTVILGDIRPGMVIEVVGDTQADGAIAAMELHLKARELIGIVQEISAAEWLVSGVRFTVSPTSQIDPRILPGDAVLLMLEADEQGRMHARAILRLPDDDYLEQEELETEPEEFEIAPGSNQIIFRGRVSEINGQTWEIGAQTVFLTSETRITSNPAKGDLVKVTGTVSVNGRIYALSIAVLIEAADSTNTQMPSGDDDVLPGGENENSASNDALGLPTNSNSAENSNNDSNENDDGNSNGDDNQGADDNTGSNDDDDDNDENDNDNDDNDNDDNDDDNDDNDGD